MSFAFWVNTCWRPSRQIELFVQEVKKQDRAMATVLSEGLFVNKPTQHISIELQAVVSTGKLI